MWLPSPYAVPVSSFAEPVIPPTSEPDGGDQAVVCFSIAWLPYVLGALHQLLLQTTWQGTADEIQLAQNRANNLISIFGQNALVCPNIMVIRNLRYDADCDCLQQTFDGGSTWVDASGLDPRHVAVFRYPHVVATDKKCQAAENMVKQLERTIIAILEGFSAAEILLTLLEILGEYIPEIGIFIDPISAGVEVILTLGITAISAAFTSGVYDTIKCILYCNLDSNGQMSAAQLTTAKAQVESLIGGAVVPLMFNLISSFVGEVGWSNAGTIDGGTVGDCSACVCSWCYEWDSAGVASADFTSQNQGGLSNFPQNHFTLADGAVTHIEFTYAWNGVGGAGDSAAAIWIPGSSRVALILPLGSYPDINTVSWDGSVTSPGSLMFGANAASGSGGAITITHVLVRGTGTLPAWAHGNEC